jgi:hypothetical protein
MKEVEVKSVIVYMQAPKCTAETGHCWHNEPRNIYTRKPKLNCERNTFVPLYYSPSDICCHCNLYADFISWLYPKYFVVEEL